VGAGERGGGAHVQRPELWGPLQQGGSHVLEEECTVTASSCRERVRAVCLIYCIVTSLIINKDIFHLSSPALLGNSDGSFWVTLANQLDLTSIWSLVTIGIAIHITLPGFHGDCPPDTCAHIHTHTHTQKHLLS